MLHAESESPASPFKWFHPIIPTCAFDVSRNAPSAASSEKGVSFECMVNPAAEYQRMKIPSSSAKLFGSGYWYAALVFRSLEIMY